LSALEAQIVGGYRRFQLVVQVQPRTGQVLERVRDVDLRPAPDWVLKTFPKAARQATPGQSLWLDRHDFVYLAEG
jgi:hypothetical protein